TTTSSCDARHRVGALPPGGKQPPDFGRDGVWIVGLSEERIDGVVGGCGHVRRNDNDLEIRPRRVRNPCEPQAVPRSGMRTSVMIRSTGAAPCSSDNASSALAASTT